jgi:hypothetical protein
MQLCACGKHVCDCEQDYLSSTSGGILPGGLDQTPGYGFTTAYRKW